MLENICWVPQSWQARNPHWDDQKKLAGKLLWGTVELIWDVAGFLQGAGYSWLPGKPAAEGWVLGNLVGMLTEVFQKLPWPWDSTETPWGKCFWVSCTWEDYHKTWTKGKHTGLGRGALFLLPQPAPSTDIMLSWQKITGSSSSIPNRAKKYGCKAQK